MSIDFWTGFLAGVVAAFLGSFILVMALMTITSRLTQRAEMAEERTWTGDDTDLHILLKTDRTAEDIIREINQHGTNW